MNHITPSIKKINIFLFHYIGAVYINIGIVQVYLEELHLQQFLKKLV